MVEEYLPRRWIIFSMTGIDFVRFTSYEIYPKNRSTNLEDFKKYLVSICWPILKAQQMWEELTTFNAIEVDLDNHSWRIQEPEGPSALDADTLLLHSLKPISEPNKESGMGRAGANRNVWQALRGKTQDMGAGLLGIKKKDNK